MTWRTTSEPAPRRGRGFVVGIATVLAVALWSSSIVEASAPTTPAERAAQEIQAARDRADAAAQALFDTEAEIDRLDIEIAESEGELAEIEAEVDAARSGLEQQAVRNFIGAGGSTMPLLIDITASNDVLAAEVYSAIATENVYVELDDFDALMVEVEESRAGLEAQRTEADAATESYASLKEQAEAQVIRLGEIEEQRLQDEAVRKALEAQQRARAEQQRREREAQAARAATAAAAAQAEAQAATQAAPPAPPVAGAAPSMGQSAESDQVTPEVAQQSSGSDLACPVAGPRAFADTWGAPRSGGRSHQGVDVISPGGTPLVAMESGRVEFSSNRLGGKTLRLYGGSSTRYYYAHLSGYAGGDRTVNAGEVVGYIGRTGNTTTNHLHLQIHPGGGQPINPYPITRAACG